METEGTSFEQYKAIAAALLVERTSMDIEAACEHIVYKKKHYQTCYDMDMSVEDAVIEDINLKGYSDSKYEKQ